MCGSRNNVGGKTVAPLTNTSAAIAEGRTAGLYLDAKETAEWAVVDSAHALPSVINPPSPGAHALVPAEGCEQARVWDWKTTGDNRLESSCRLPGNGCVDLFAPLQRYYSLMWPTTATEPREEA
jgi:hypothetical protein